MRNLLKTIMGVMFSLLIVTPLHVVNTRAENYVDASLWSTTSYNIETKDETLIVSGTGRYGDKVSTFEKIDISGYKVTMDFDYNFNEGFSNFDWIAIVFAPIANPFVSSGASVSIILRPQNVMNFSIMTSTFAEISRGSTPRTEGDIYTIETELTDSSFSVSVNGVKISTSSASINYSILARGSYNSFCVNDGTSSTENSFTMKLSEMNIVKHDSTKDVIIYGSTITMEDERIKSLESENFRVENKNKENGCNSSIGISKYGIVLMTFIIFQLIREKNNSHGVLKNR